MQAWAVTFSVLFLSWRIIFQQPFLKVFLPLVVVLGPATPAAGAFAGGPRQKLGRKRCVKSEALRAITEAPLMVLDEDGRYLEIKAPDNNLLIAGGEDLLGRRVADVLAASPG